MFGDYSVAMVTPFLQNGDVDWRALEGLVDHLLSHQVKGLLISGSTGEQHAMSVEERTRLYQEVVRIVAGRANVFAGVAATTTYNALQLAEAAQRAGAQGIMLGLPPYSRPSDAELVEYVTEVARSVSLPILLYNNPPRTGTDIGVDAVVDLVKQGSIVALKHSSDFAKAETIIQRTDGRVKLYTGGDIGFLDALAHGYTGITSIIGNLLPEEMGAVVHLAKGGNLAEASTRHAAICEVAEAVFATSTPVGLKYAMRKRGLPAGYCRKPLGFMSNEQAERIDQALRTDGN